MPTLEQIGHRIRVLRTIRRLTQVQLAARVGISQYRLSNIERGKAEPGILLCIDLARVLDINVEHLACLTNVKRPFTEE